ncbi:hypothetical protein LX59_02511 [Azomonas agilis]|uniref:DUF192 domain-containing protein n=1 Tax=Azomonas agilis TaxID=116849 RepID=A0A562I0W3_9GAMM|nr:DUF192 domain-containing protein [Azomonas agilis]TWH64308.1 hypothetical protein LX59_02511 [Azomonas agilis]
MRLVLLAGLLGLGLLGQVGAQEPDGIALRLGTQVLQVEVADTPETQRRGLMERTELPESGGMLFVFDQLSRRCLWMKNTPLPLSAAFMDDQGRILNLVDLEPQDLTPHCSRLPARFALEVNQGWFQRHGIQPGALIEGLPLTPSKN